MKAVTVKTTDLLAALKKNRDQHKATFDKATKVFRERVIKHLDSALDSARRGGDIILRVSLPVPEDHTDDYDRAIQMLEMATESELTISAVEFDQYVRDKWHWAQSFNSNTVSYTS